MRRSLGFGPVGSFGRFHGAARIHQLLHNSRLVVGIEIWIAHPPEFPPDDEIATVRHHGMLEAVQMKGFPPVTATVVPDV